MASLVESSRQVLDYPVVEKGQRIKDTLLSQRLLSDEERQPLIEQWKNAPRRIVNYEEGNYPDGTHYPSGRRLLIGKKGQEEQVMDTFEGEWCRATVETMFEGKTGPLTVVERGYGLGIMSNYILRQMLSRGGEHHIIELNRQIYEDAVKWANRTAQKVINRLEMPLKISIYHGDADEVTQANFTSQSIDLFFSDTHQLQEGERGINDLLQLEEVKKRLKPDGRFTFCPFHKHNQKGGLDARQIALIFPHFEKWGTVRHVEVIPPKDCTYLQGPKRRLPVVICEKPIL